jgi:hypothetical protein
MVREKTRRLHLGVFVRSSDTVLFLKGQVQFAWEMASIREDSMTFKKEGSADRVSMDDNRTLGSYGVKQGSEIWLVPKGGGGAATRVAAKKKGLKKRETEQIFRDVIRRDMTTNSSSAKAVATAITRLVGLEQQAVQVFKAEMLTLPIEALSAMVGIFDPASGGQNENKVLQLAPYFYGSLYTSLMTNIEELEHCRDLLEKACAFYFNQSYLDGPSDRFLIDSFKKDVLAILSKPRTPAGALVPVVPAADVEM